MKLSTQNAFLSLPFFAASQKGVRFPDFTSKKLPVVAQQQQQPEEPEQPPPPQVGPGQNLITPRRGKGILKQPQVGMRIPLCGGCQQQVRSAKACSVDIWEGPEPMTSDLLIPFMVFLSTLLFFVCFLIFLPQLDLLLRRALIYFFLFHRSLCTSVPQRIAKNRSILLNPQL